ncbi:MAG: hypothetical protein V4553_06650 [Bacteroidota bacterium]
MPATIYIEAACFIVAVICLIRDANWVWRSMALFLLITCLTEITGKLLRSGHHSNQWLYNVYLLFEAGFTSLMFNKVLSKYINSKILIIGGAGVFLASYVYDLIGHGFLVFNDITATVMSVVFVIYSFLYFYLLIRDDQYVDLIKSPAFWWVTGALFFYFGSTAVNLFFAFLRDVQVAGHNITYFIFSALSAILYACWSYSFICRRWQTTSKN